MSLVLGDGFTVVKTSSITGKEVLTFCDKEMSIEDFFGAALYVLTNVDFPANEEETNPKVRFITMVKKMITCPNENQSNMKRIVLKGDENKPLSGYSLNLATTF